MGLRIVFIAPNSTNNGTNATIAFFIINKPSQNLSVLVQN